MKRYRFIYIIIYFLLTFVYDSNAVDLKGIVRCYEENELPVIGATIKVENTVLGTYADKSGKFVVKNVPENYKKIIVSAVGYKTQSINIDDNKNADSSGMIILLERAAVSSNGIVVTATRSEKLYDDVPVKVSVLTDKIFESTASLNLRDGLSFQPGLRVETNCQNCGFSEIRMNGLEGKYSQVLIDGKAIYSSLNGVYGLEQIPANMIERVEIVRGGGSALYGGNSIAGVVNIITKTPSVNFFSVSGNYSSINGIAPDGSLNLNGAIVNEEGNLGVYIFGMNRHRKDWDANNDGFTEVGRLDVKNLGATLFYKPNHLSKLSFEYHTIFHEIRGGDLLKLPPHETNITEMSRHNTNVFQIQYEQYFGSGLDKISVYGSGQITERHSYYGSDKDLNAYGSTDNNTLAAGLQYSRIEEGFLGSHIFTFGYEINRDKMIDLAPAYSRTIDQLTLSQGVYIQDDIGLTDEIYLVLGSRFDKHNLIDRLIVSPRLNLMFKPFDNFSLRTSLSTGFRAPQAFDEDLHITQVGGEGMIIKPAENLRPEYSKSFSFSADYVFDLLGNSVSISNEYFYTKLNDVFILENAERDESGFLIIERRNGESASVFGTTFELMMNISDMINLKGGITYQNSVYQNPVEWAVSDDGSESQYTDKILRTPDFYGYFTFQFAVNQNFNINISGVYTGSMYLPHFAGGISFDGNKRNKNELKRSHEFFEINTMISYKISDWGGLELQFGCQNILNSYQNDFDIGAGRDAGYVYGPSRPRTFFIGFKSQII